MMIRICRSSVAASAAFRKMAALTKRSSIALFSSSDIVEKEKIPQSSRHTYVEQQQQHEQPRIVIVGGGITGIATAYYLIKNHGLCNITIVEQGRQAMSLTSAQSGENYRNWWPHVTMIQFTNRSINLMEEIAIMGNHSESLGDNANNKNRIDMTRRGYVLATRQKDTMDKIVEQLLNVQKQQQDKQGLSSSSEHRNHNLDNEIRFHEGSNSMVKYQSSSTFGGSIENWNIAPTGIDILTSKDLIRNEFPSFDPSCVEGGIVHIRRAGDINSYSLGCIMLQYIRNNNGGNKILLLNTTVNNISYNSQNHTFDVNVVTTSSDKSGREGGRNDDNDDNDDSTTIVVADYLVNAAGPLANNVLEKLMMNSTTNNKEEEDGKGNNAGGYYQLLPIKNIYQQKVAFEDHVNAIPRHLPFCIDLDSQYIDWTDEERDSLLLEDDDNNNLLQYLLKEFPGSIHCRPDGHSTTGKWIKLGWAFNETPSDPTHFDLLIDKKNDADANNSERNKPTTIRNLPSQSTLMNDWFPEIVLRGAARLHPSLRAYYDGKLPHNRHHYGGWYSMTEENWPIIGPLISIPNNKSPSSPPLSAVVASSPTSQPHDDPTTTASLGTTTPKQLFDGRVFLNCAPSGFGTMTACAGGELCAAWIATHPGVPSSSRSSESRGPTILPEYAKQLSLYRYHDHDLMTSLRESEKGLL